MFTYILAAFLQMEPYALVAFFDRYDSKKDCMAAVEEMKPKLPEDKRDNLVCIQVVVQDKVRDI